MEENILELRHITKRFAGVVALKDVSLNIRRGEVRALVGENGAGKSTLIKVITGAHEPTEGELWFDGRKIEHNNPSLAKQMGVGVIYQELNLMPHLTVVENLFFGRELKKGPVLDKKRMLDECRSRIAELGVKIDPNAKVRELTIAQQQIVEIVKAVSQDIRFLIMDEPTAPLTTNEIEKMFEIVDHLKSKGISILYISHRLEEIFRLSDTVTILRDGQLVQTLPTAQTDRAMLIRLMVGREITNDYPPRQTPVGEVLMEVKGLTNRRISDCSFSLRRGEILGFAGLVGAGRTELARAIYGADRTASGTVSIRGEKKDIRSTRQGIEAGIGLITEDRKAQGLLLTKGIDFNITYASLNKVSRMGVISKKKENEVTDRYIQAMRIRCYSAAQPTRTLSGGNQQKVVLGKWLATDSDILIFDEPTRGIDVGAKREIYQLMRSLSEQGKTIIMISSEMAEVIGMCDRVLVMKKGTIAGELSGENITQERIMELAAN